MTGHTPGPWAVVGHDWPGFLNITGASFNITVVTQATDLDFNDYVTRTADAHLIAAAPELLEACQHALKTLREIPDSPMTASEVLLDYAITKATKL